MQNNFVPSQNGKLNKLFEMEEYINRLIGKSNNKTSDAVLCGSI